MGTSAREESPTLCERVHALEESNDGLRQGFTELKDKFEVVEAQLGHVHAVLTTYIEEHTKMRKGFNALVESNTEMVDWFKQMDKLQRLLELAGPKDGD